MSKTLSDAVDEFLAHRRASYARNTALTTEQAMRKFLLVVGNVQTRSLGPEHGERFQSWLISSSYAPNSVNGYMSSLSSFGKWASARRYVRTGASLVATTRHLKAPEKPRLRIPAKDFARVLDGCRPDVRIMLALGFYLFLRESEACALRIADVRLDSGEVHVTVKKSKLFDVMPICAELDDEMRRWLTAYATDVGGLAPHYYLVPAHMPTQPWHIGPLAQHYQPERRVCRPARLVNQALETAGYRTRDDEGKPTREGMHTLRRSGARAYYDEMVSTGSVRDNVLRQVMAMLHHKSVTVTERYLGLEADRERRDLNLRGRRMFSSVDTGNVIAMERKAT